VPGFNLEGSRIEVYTSCYRIGGEEMFVQTDKAAADSSGNAEWFRRGQESMALAARDIDLATAEPAA